MKGAIAEPCVRTTRPPKINKDNRMGNNQNFFLVRIRAKISLNKDIMTPKIDFSEYLRAWRLCLSNKRLHACQSDTLRDPSPRLLQLGP